MILRFLMRTRYFILLPIIGLVIAAIFFFVFGGVGLISLLWDLLLDALGITEGVDKETGVIIYEVVEHVHMFLIGTVLYLTAVGFFQLFIKEIDFPHWMKIRNTEELETNLVGVTVVVLAVQFLGLVFAGETQDLLQYGAGIAVPIAALGLFIGLRAWASRSSKGKD